MRSRDTVTIESLGNSRSVVIDRATQYEITTSLRSPSIARFELGDETTWPDLQQIVGIGGRYKVSVNGQARVTGRLLTRNLAASAGSGATVQLAIRTLLADALFTAVDPKIGVRNVTLKELVLAAFRRLGLTERDFVFKADVARDAITGRKSGQPSAAAGIRARLHALENQDLPPGTTYQQVAKQREILRQQLAGAETRPVVPDLQEITLEEARPHPPESVWSFVDRHLARHGLMMWDGADGRIVVGKPDDGQRPLYQLTMLRGAAAEANNLTEARKVEDFEQVPELLWVFGMGGGRDQAKARVKYNEFDPVLASVYPPLDRTVLVVDESISTLEQAQARARRELLERSFDKDAWYLETDGLSYWTGSQAIPYAVDTVADVRVDVAGTASGAYLIHECTMIGDAQTGHTTRLVAVGRGIWNI